MSGVLTHRCVESPLIIPFYYFHNRGIPRDKSSAIVLERMSDSEVKEYWENITGIIPEYKLKVWMALEAGLKKYQ